MSDFRYNSYWGTWSRVLRRMSADATQVEVNLTPINPYMSSGWERNKKVIIRSHVTQPDRSDKDTQELPALVLDRMTAEYGEDLTRRLLEEDFLPEIDWDKYAAVCNGGAPFDAIRKDAA